MRKIEPIESLGKEERELPLPDFSLEEERSAHMATLDFFRHIDDRWMDELLKENELLKKRIDSVSGRRLITSAIRKMMESTRQ
jgi:hypothetical protein